MLTLRAEVALNGLTPEDVDVEAIYGSVDADDQLSDVRGRVAEGRRVRRRVVPVRGRRAAAAHRVTGLYRARPAAGMTCWRLLRNWAWWPRHNRRRAQGAGPSGAERARMAVAARAGLVLVCRSSRLAFRSSTSDLAASVPPSGQFGSGGGSVGRIARSFAMFKASLRVLNTRKELVIFPVLSGIATLILAAGFLVPGLLASRHSLDNGDQLQPVSYVVLTMSPLPAVSSFSYVPASVKPIGSGHERRPLAPSPRLRAVMCTHLHCCGLEG